MWVGRDRSLATPMPVSTRSWSACPRSWSSCGLIFAGLFQQLRQGETPALGPFEEKLLDRFREDGEFNAKTAWFLKNLAPPLRRPEIERRYRLNYLWGKYGIPSLD